MNQSSSIVQQQLLTQLQSYLPLQWQSQLESPLLMATQLLAQLRAHYNQASPIDLIKDYLFLLLIYKSLHFFCKNLYMYGPLGSLKKIHHIVSKKFFNFILHSILTSKVDKEISKALDTIQEELIRDDPSLLSFPALPSKGLSHEEIMQEVDRMQAIIPHSNWEDGRVSGAVYHGGKQLIHLQSIVYEKFCVANQLHPDVFPAVRKMESEIVSMVLNMFNAPSTGCGTSTSGGTESLLLACLSAKMYAYHHRGIRKPEMIAPITAHAGFDKASYYFGIKLHHVELDPVTFQVDLKKVKRLINKNTILLVGSAPNYPHGIIDDIEGLSVLATRYNIPLHVDCCLGSFIIAFMEKAGFHDLPLFDFRLPGVTSISCDTHKYGFAPKGSSTIMYRTPELRQQQYYVDPHWTGGLYGSPTLAGSRPGALMAGCWATMVNIGDDGYTKSSHDLVTIARRMKKFIQENIKQVQIIGDPLLTVVALRSNVIDIHEMADKMSKKGWHLCSLQRPASVHICVTRSNFDKIDETLRVLKEVADEMAADPNAKPSSAGTSALYGVAGSVKTTGVVDKMIVGFLDALYKLSPEEFENTKSKDHARKY
ncbi:hypothetical protein TBLA_0A02880 [Henningerozyma blattae CBS 6284]|uniref:sphinganine-1-phosphate aldolase n=1 Tax=Henningerozyma blattae (strain ATCC 34711 / CBS 6284 / DSM 70876 / NBRC 10599 / NRRL Y-10934 / UCD 77-7) TaxID=1071380 RepID=I2GVD6_HENB6|nr:hypothetical protein TBLA_0A02880 [Tetrapisispora blattae CBS 6284]CCH58088.1 hypothetical protein TBLA_0A02880 [Tetrapisispora blattae CBS 6284]